MRLLSPVEQAFWDLPGYALDLPKAYLVEEEIRPRGLDISFAMGAR